MYLKVIFGLEAKKKTFLKEHKLIHELLLGNFVLSIV